MKNNELDSRITAVGLILVFVVLFVCAGLKWNSNMQEYAEGEVTDLWLAFIITADRGVYEPACDTCVDRSFQWEEAFDRKLKQIVDKRDERLSKQGICSTGGWYVSIHMPFPRAPHKDSWYYPCRASSIISSLIP